MIVIPAVDVKGGRCVRLFQGRMDRETVFSDRPEEMAAAWEAKGARLIHVVDLDGAVKKSPQNADTIRLIRKRVSVPVQVGGGIRDLETVELYINMGINRVILGTAALQDPSFLKEACARFPGAVIAGIDARDNRVAVDGWTKETAESPLDVARRLQASGVAAIIHTDISRDGMRTGPNLEATSALCRAVTVPVICAGGVTTVQDIKDLLALGEPNLWGVITGRAVYEGTLDLEEAIRITDAGLTGEGGR